MHHKLIYGFGLAAVLAAASAASAQLSIKDEMKQPVEPAANALFAIAGEADPANGEAPPPDARWREAADQAKALQLIGEDMLRPDRALEAPEWRVLAREMRDLAADAARAAKAKDGEALAASANALADNCFACHGKFKDQSGA